MTASSEHLSRETAVPADVAVACVRFSGERETPNFTGESERVTATTLSPRKWHRHLALKDSEHFSTFF